MDGLNVVFGEQELGGVGKVEQRFKPLNSHLVRQSDDWTGPGAGGCGQSAAEVLTTGGQDRAVGPETAVPHHHSHITQDVLLSLLIQALEDM